MISVTFCSDCDCDSCGEVGRVGSGEGGGGEGVEWGGGEGGVRWELVVYPRVPVRVLSVRG